CPAEPGLSSRGPKPRAIVCQTFRRRNLHYIPAVSETQRKRLDGDVGTRRAPLRDTEGVLFRRRRDYLGSVARGGQPFPQPCGQAGFENFFRVVAGVDDGKTG